MTRILTLLAGAALLFASCASIQSTSSPSSRPAEAPVVGSLERPTIEVASTAFDPVGDDRRGAAQRLPVPAPPAPAPQSESVAPRARVPESADAPAAEDAYEVGSLARWHAVPDGGAGAAGSGNADGGVAALFESAQIPVPAPPLPKASGPSRWKLWGLTEAGPVPYTLGIRKPRSEEQDGASAGDTDAAAARATNDAPAADPAASSAATDSEPAKEGASQPPDRPLPGPPPSADPSPPETRRQASTVESEIPSERVTTSINATTTITLPGVGWTYLGNADAVEYTDRAVRDGETEFTFRPTAAGRHNLQFQRQDLTRGKTESTQVLLAVSDEELRSERAIARQGQSATTSSQADDAAPRSESTSESEAEPGSNSSTASRPAAFRSRNGAGEYARARELEAGGNKSAALNAYLRQYDGNPRVAYDVANLADELDESRIAEFFWNEVAGGSGAAAIEAHRRLFEGAVAALTGGGRDARRPGATAAERGGAAPAGNEGSPEQAAFRHFQELDRHGHTPDRKDGVILARALLDGGMPGNAEEVLNAVGVGGESTPAELLYLMGRAYEAQQRPDHAIRYYRSLLDRHILSPYYERARERYEYLRRHFLHVR